MKIGLTIRHLIVHLTPGRKLAPWFILELLNRFVFVFVLDGKPLALDRPFTANGTLYPANWLRLSSPDQRAAIGITEEPDPPVWDQRFYWGYDAEGQLIPKDHGQLVTQWVDQTKTTANTLLQPTDWMIVREADNGTVIDPEVKARRQEIREFAGIKITAIEATTTTEELAAYITGPEYPIWEAVEPPIDPSEPDLTVSGGFVDPTVGEDTIVL